DARLEWGELAIATACSLREERDNSSTTQPPQGLLHSRCTHPLALDRERSHRANQEPKDRNEQSRPRHVIERPPQRNSQEKDIEEAEMVGDQEDGPGRRHVVPARGTPASQGRHQGCQHVLREPVPEQSLRGRRGARSALPAGAGEVWEATGSLTAEEAPEKGTELARCSSKG